MLPSDGRLSRLFPKEFPAGETPAWRRRRTCIPEQGPEFQDEGPKRREMGPDGGRGSQKECGLPGESDREGMYREKAEPGQRNGSLGERTGPSPVLRNSHPQGQSSPVTEDVPVPLASGCWVAMCGMRVYTKTWPQD